MKGIVLASLMSVAYAGAVVILFRVRRPKNRAGMMFKAYLATLPMLALGLAATPPDLGFLPPWLVEPSGWLDACFSIFIYSASVLGGWLQLYNLADRGLSLRILIDAEEHRHRALDVPLVRASYGAGKGIDWMYEKRLADLLSLRLVALDGGDLMLTRKGLRNARLLRALRKLFLIPTGDK